MEEELSNEEYVPTKISLEIDTSELNLIQAENLFFKIKTTLGIEYPSTISKEMEVLGYIDFEPKINVLMRSYAKEILRKIGERIED
jgi:hypothetical protein